MSTTEASRQVIMSIYGAAGTRDLKTMDSYLAPNFVVLEADGLPYGGRYEGAIGFHGLIERLDTVWVEPSVTDMEYIADGNKVLAKFNLVGKSTETGTAINMPVIEYWEVENGLATICQPYYFDTAQVRKICGLP